MTKTLKTPGTQEGIKEYVVIDAYTSEVLCICHNLEFFNEVACGLDIEFFRVEADGGVTCYVFRRESGAYNGRYSADEVQRLFRK